jgi:hypothetical protein
MDNFFDDPLGLDPLGPLTYRDPRWFVPARAAWNSRTTNLSEGQTARVAPVGPTGHSTGDPPGRCAARSGSVAVMNTTEDVRPPLNGHPTPVEVSAELIEVTGGGLRIAELGVVTFLGLLVCPPLLILAIVVAVPVIAISAVVAAVVAAIAVPTVLVRHVLAHHRAHGSTLFLHRLRS